MNYLHLHLHSGYSKADAAKIVAVCLQNEGGVECTSAA